MLWLRIYGADNNSFNLLNSKRALFVPTMTDGSQAGMHLRRRCLGHCVPARRLDCLVAHYAKSGIWSVDRCQPRAWG